MLPKLDTPTYELELPLSKKKIKYRPFLVKEQRNLLMAMESRESESIERAIHDILDVCTLNEKINVEELPILDVEYYFIQLRAKSVGEIVEARYKCNTEIDDDECGNIMETKIDISNIKVTNDSILSDVIQLTDAISIKLKYPEYSVINKSYEYSDLSDMTFNMIAKSIEYIYDGDQYYYAKELSTNDIVKFLEDLTVTQFAKIEDFFNNLPKLEQHIKLTCSKCGSNHDITVEGLESFFF